MARSAFPGKLNLFQRMMLRWRDLYPYNAVHAVHVARPFDRAAVTREIAATIEHWGIAGYALDARRRRFAYRGGPYAPELAVHDGGVAADAMLQQVIAGELNRPFATDSPMRFIVVTEAEGYMLGISYDHFIAGGDSIAMLLGAIVAELLGSRDVTAAREPPPSLYPATYATLLRSHPGWFVGALRAMPALVRETKRALRLRDRDPDDLRNAYVLVRLTPAQTLTLRDRAHGFGVTTHDLVIAVTLNAIARITPQRLEERERNGIGVASIVNIRRDFGAGHVRAFGQFLAGMRVTHTVPEGTGLADIARDVRDAIEPVKRRRLYLQTLFGLAAASLAWPFISRRQRSRFYHKHHPACAGISMLAADPLWPEAVRPAQRYTRAVSTGPATPAVLAVSTTSAALSIGMSWRPTALSDEFSRVLESEILSCANAMPC